jgi:DNA-binding MarR family transcriptional regulator
MNKTTSERNREIAYGLSNNLSRLLREFSRDFERRVWEQLADRGFSDIRPSHSQVFANLALGAVRVTELAARARVSQQAMGKMLKELERMGYVARDIDQADRRAREIRLTPKGIDLAETCLEVVAAVRGEYESRVGARRLADLEDRLREVVGLLELDYLPESWQENSGE